MSEASVSDLAAAREKIRSPNPQEPTFERLSFSTRVFGATSGDATARRY
jgi:hypothetical protein